MQWVAARLDVPAAHVKGVATFYTLFNKEPVGRHQVWVCRTLSCALGGADAILHHCEKRLGIHAGQTTPDGKVTLRSAECLASCGTAPMMQINFDYHENLTPEKIDQVLWASAIDSDIPLNNAMQPGAHRDVEIQLDGGLLVRAGLSVGAGQRLSDYLESQQTFIPMRGAQLRRAARPPAPRRLQRPRRTPPHAVRSAAHPRRPG